MSKKLAAQDPKGQEYGQQQDSALKHRGRDSTLKGKNKEGTLKGRNKEGTLKGKNKESTLKSKNKDSTLKGKNKDSILKESSKTVPSRQLQEQSPYDSNKDGSGDNKKPRYQSCLL